ncbi:MAG: hypothetical protein H6741_14725 [Alphaproteobacteria bacterium]|nr:hypothetical protein [Alphaproteobacteria bacterium]MCB9793972.1 hypothetical protein [Alphaproteobacteria bacterium]
MQAALDDYRTAPISERLRAALRFLTVFVPPGADFGEAELQALREAGVDDQGIRDLMYASFCFQNLGRWADAMGWPILDEDELAQTSQRLAQGDYSRMSAPPDVPWTGVSEG